MTDGRRATRLELRELVLAVPEGAGRRTLARDLSLRLPAGRIVALNGPSGSGKSTLLRCCIRLHRPDHGQVLFDGAPVERIPPPELRRRIAYIRQSPAFPPTTVVDALKEPFRFRARLRDTPPADELAGRLRSLGLPETMLAARAPALSGGEAQRVALARAMLPEPEVLLLDEPTASLDPEHELGIVSFVRDWVSRDGHSALWVTHDRSLLRALAVETHELTPDGLKPTGPGR
ncbi:MAG: putative iron export ATP-binding protein FetA [Calditrichaeota bacterium]|nr:putative iron export ATP-binding protein FetA [Calditrichota bacterium]